MYQKAEALCKEYATTKGQGTFARPANHIFFKRLGPVLKRTLEKCEREKWHDVRCKICQNTLKLYSENSFLFTLFKHVKLKKEISKDSLTEYVITYDKGEIF